MKKLTFDQAPKIELDWEEGLFRGIRSLLSRLRPSRRAEFDPNTVALAEDHLGRLSVLARIVAGVPVQLQITSGDPGVRGEQLLLSAWVDVGDPDTSADVLLVSACLLAAVHKLGLRLESAASEGQRLALELDWAQRALAELDRELPLFGERFARASAAVLASRPAFETLKGRQRAIEEARQRALGGRWPEDLDALAKELDRASVKGRESSPPVPLWGRPILFASSGESLDKGLEQQRTPSGQELAAPVAVDDIERKVLEVEEDFNLIVHTFEKVETLDNHRGGYRDTDGSDELDDQLEALEEVDLKEVVRGGAPVEAILRADITLPTEIPDVRDIPPGIEGVSYDEWDQRKGRYRKKWCTVYPGEVAAADPTFGQAVLARRRKTIEELTHRLWQHRHRLEAVKRQRDGDDIDLDAVISNLADWRAGNSGDERLYVLKRRKRREVATLVLMDISLSTDSWIDNQRVLDVAREAAVVLGEVAHGLGDELDILAFASHTRNICRVYNVSRRGESWRKGRDRIGALRPQGYTRIGPALRHATAELVKTGVRKKLLILLSDGKPVDYDRYEGRHGMADVRMALREAHKVGVTTRALTIDTRAQPYLTATFGPGQWSILPHPDKLSEVLTATYGVLTG